jgi:hypothetical protein
MLPLDYWTPEKFEISSHSFGISERKNKTYKGSGSDNTGKCTYTYNELGFRGDYHTKQGFRIMSIGCSLTEGVGVNDNETWSHLFSKRFLNGVDLNFGCGGRSNDYISRCLLTYYDMINPDLVLIMYTYPYRRDLYTPDGGIEPFIPHVSWGWLKETEEGTKTHKMLVNLQNDPSDLVNWYKNHLLIKYFLESKKCNWVWNGSHGVDKEYKESNRFDGDYSFILDKGVDGTHPGPFHNMKYSENLFDHIKNNFPEYLPE